MRPVASCVLRNLAAIGPALAVALGAMNAHAGNPRPLFEPTDLDLENPGTLQVDTQLGELRGPDAARAVVPDFEFDLGLARNVELDVDSQYAIEGPSARGFTWDRPGPDNLWVASKLGLWDAHDGARRRAWAIGVQLGPKIPIAHGARGVGYEGLVLVERSVGEMHLVLNLGALIDPGSGVSTGRSEGIEGGVDVNLPLNKSASLTLLGEFGGVRFLSDDRHQLHATAGLSWAATKSTDLSLIGLKGLLSGGDRYGVLAGIAQRFSLWD